tara:strand:- start:1720 stop:2307 length:588 start_codon:yes stop_codon:yes gene_type:complete
MAHLKLNTKQWLQLGKKLGYIENGQIKQSAVAVGNSYGKYGKVILLGRGETGEAKFDYMGFVFNRDSDTNRDSEFTYYLDDPDNTYPDAVYDDYLSTYLPDKPTYGDMIGAIDQFISQDVIPDESNKLDEEDLKDFGLGGSGESRGKIIKAIKDYAFGQDEIAFENAQERIMEGLPGYLQQDRERAWDQKRELDN